MKLRKLSMWSLLGLMLVASPAQAEEPAPRSFELDAEYRVRNLHLRPWELSGTQVGNATWTQQRLRIDASSRQEGVGAVVVQLDILDGVIFGDNGAFGKDPSTVSGVSLAAKQPNNTVWEMGLMQGRDPLDPDSYAPSLKSAEAIKVNHAYGQVYLPVGLLQIGRQPMATGNQISAHDGGRHNRWGVSTYSDTADRVLFATKLSEVYRALRDGADYKPDRSMDDGVFMGVFYDWMTQGSIFKLKDDLGQAGGALMFKKSSADWFGLDWGNTLIFLRAVRLQNEQFESDVWGFPCRAEASIGDWKLMLQGGYIYGHSREISEGFATLSGSDPTRQKIEGLGAQAVLDWEVGPATLTMEADYATGDDDPRTHTSITSFSFARDLNVGLLLFEHILAFESARSVAVGIENLSSLDAASFPLTEARTEGRFTNAIALFPQLKLDWVDNHNHKFHTRFGVLFAWPEATGGAVDPIRTILADDGLEISDDAKNFHGGDPGDYYGTEYDLQLQWTFKDRFVWSLEGALLMPGSSLEDEHFQATPSFMMENRFLFLF